MNFFPNLQVIFNISTPLASSQPPPPPSTSTASTETTTSTTTSESISNTSPTVSQVIHRILRPNAPLATSSDSAQTEDVHLYVNLDAMYPPIMGLTMEQIHEMTTLQVMENQTSGAVLLCTICQNPCDAGSIVQTLRPCSHCFHPVCIQRWLVLQNSCPLCRTVLVPTSG